MAKVVYDDRSQLKFDLYVLNERKILRFPPTASILRNRLLCYRCRPGQLAGRRGMHAAVLRSKKINLKLVISIVWTHV